MNRSDAQAAVACLSPAALAVWEADTMDFEGIDQAIIIELIAAGLLETVPSWSDKARDVQHALEPPPGVDELIERIESEGFLDAVECFEAWNTESLADYGFDVDHGAVVTIVAEAASTIRAAYSGALDQISALPPQQERVAA